MKTVKKIQSVLLCICILAGMMSNFVFASENDQIITLTDGQTYDIGNFSHSVCARGHEFLVQINSPGTYTLTGYNPTHGGAETSGRVQINSACTVVLRDFHLSHVQMLNDDKSYYLGGTRGAFEIAQNIEVNIVLENENSIATDAFYYLFAESSGILLNSGSKIIISGTGSLNILSTIGRVLGSGQFGYIKMKSGLLSCQNIGNYRLNGNGNAIVEKSSKSIQLEYEGGSFYAKDDDMSSNFKDWYTANQVLSDMYRIKIPASGSTKIKRGANGVFSQTTAWDGYVYAWVDHSDFINSSPIAYYVLSDNGYHRYEVTYSSNNEEQYLFNAVLADRAEKIGGVSGTLKNTFDTTYAGAKISFQSTDGDGKTLSCVTEADGSYNCRMPVGTYTVTASIDGDTFSAGSVTITTENSITQDFVFPCVRGKVTSTDNAPLNNAVVILKYGTTTRRLITNDTGEYTFTLPKDSGITAFNISASKFGYQSHAADKVLGQDGSEVNFSLVRQTDMSNISITTEGDLIALAGLAEGALNDATVNLYADIYLPDNSTFTSIKTQYNITFNGNGYRIDNLKCPLFEQVLSNNADCTIVTSFFKGLHLSGKIDINLREKAEYVGAFCRKGSSLAFDNCSFGMSEKGPVNNSIYGSGYYRSYTGGFVGGYHDKGRPIEFKNCSVNVLMVDSGGILGGFVGYTYGTIKAENCFARCAASDTENTNIGALAGGIYGVGGTAGNIGSCATTVTNMYVKEVISKSEQMIKHPLANNTSWGGYSTKGVYINENLSAKMNSSASVTMMDEADMTALPGTTGSLIGQLNSRVTLSNGYATWYPQSDGFPGFYQTNPVAVTGGKAAFSGGGGSGSTVYYVPGETVTVTADVPTGMHFAGWTITSGTVALSSATDETVTFEMPDTAVTLLANYMYPPVPDINTLPTTSVVEPGHSLSECTFIGGEVAVEDNSINGTFAWKDGTITPSLSDSQTTPYIAVFTPNDLMSAQRIEFPMTVTVAHSYDVWTDNDDGTHSSSCSVCGKALKTEAHAYDKWITNGNDTHIHTCSVCGATQIGDHSYDGDGYCIACGDYQAATDNNGIYEISNAGQLLWFAKQVNNGDTAINGKLMEPIDLNRNYSFTFDPDTGLVEVKKDEITAGYFGSGAKGDAGGNTFFDETASTKGNFYLSKDSTDTTTAPDLRMWTPIGSYDRQYAGTFDGNDKTISGIYFNNLVKGYVGLFGFSKGKDASIHNLTVADSLIIGWSNIGGVCGYREGTGTIISCTNTGIVIGNQWVGGVCGNLFSNTIQYCSNAGTVIGSDQSVGGICGEVMGGAQIQYSYNTGLVIADQNVGGVSGHMSNGSVQHCYNTGAVSGQVNVGGVCGKNEFSEFQYCFYLDSNESDLFEGTSCATAADFADGTVAYLLNDGNNQNNPPVWYQNLDNGETPDASPKFTGGTVYYVPELNKYSNYPNGIPTPVISVTITWGAMEFTYIDASEGTWNADTLSYDNPTAAKWICNTDANKITVTSESNVELTASFRYEKAEGETAVGSFTDGTNPVIAALPIALGHETPQTVVAYLKIDGKLKETASNTVVGTVTVTIGD